MVSTLECDLFSELQIGDYFSAVLVNGRLLTEHHQRAIYTMHEKNVLQIPCMCFPMQVEINVCGNYRKFVVVIAPYQLRCRRNLKASGDISTNLKS